MTELRYTRHAKERARKSLAKNRALIEEGLEYIRACEDSRLTMHAVFKELEANANEMEGEIETLEFELNAWIRLSMALNAQRIAALNAIQEVRKLLSPGRGQGN